MPPKPRKVLKTEEFKPYADIRNHRQIECGNKDLKYKRDISELRRYESSVWVILDLTSFYSLVNVPINTNSNFDDSQKNTVFMDTTMQRFSIGWYWREDESLHAKAIENKWALEFFLKYASTKQDLEVQRSEIKKGN